MAVEKMNQTSQTNRDRIELRIASLQVQQDPNPYSYSVVNQTNSNNASKLDLAVGVIERYRVAWDKLAD